MRTFCTDPNAHGLRYRPRITLMRLVLAQTLSRPRPDYQGLAPSFRPRLALFLRVVSVWYHRSAQAREIQRKAAFGPIFGGPWGGLLAPGRRRAQNASTTEHMSWRCGFLCSVRLIWCTGTLDTSFFGHGVTSKFSAPGPTPVCDRARIFGGFDDFSPFLTVERASR